MQAIAYVRVSTEEQADSGVSIESQESTIRAYCTLRGLELAEIVVDAGVSGGDALESRDGGKRVLEAVRKRQAQVVIACKLDRLFRDACDCLGVTKVWDRAGVALHLLDMGGETLNTSSPMGRAFLTNAAAFAELERALIRERTKAAMACKRRSHQRISRLIPYGWTLGLDGKQMSMEPTEQAAIDDMRTMRLTGMTYREIASALDSRGVKSREGRAWQPNSVRLILKRNPMQSAA
jgi:DNA invertase Pin-like site-specific DNA recombinase